MLAQAGLSISQAPIVHATASRVRILRTSMFPTKWGDLLEACSNKPTHSVGNMLVLKDTQVHYTDLPMPVHYIDDQQLVGHLSKPLEHWN